MADTSPTFSAILDRTDLAGVSLRFSNRRGWTHHQSDVVEIVAIRLRRQSHPELKSARGSRAIRNSVYPGFLDQLSSPGMLVLKSHDLPVFNTRIRIRVQRRCLRIGTRDCDCGSETDPPRWDLETYKEWTAAALLQADRETSWLDRTTGTSPTSSVRQVDLCQGREKQDSRKVVNRRLHLPCFP
jgi:hypothetical protein